MNENMALTESTYYILLALAQPRHGYGIMQQTEQLSGGRVRLAAGTLYGALNALCEKGWIVPVPAQEESRRKEYRLTQQGESVLRGELERLRELVRNGEIILEQGAKEKTVFLPRGRWQDWKGQVWEGGRAVTLPVTLADIPHFTRL